MASPQVGSVPTKLSFAKVAAMNVPNAPAPTSTTTEDKKFKSQDVGARRKTMISTKDPPTLSQVTSAAPDVKLGAKTSEAVLATPAIGSLTMVEQSAAAVNGSKSARSGDSAEDDQSHLSSSSTKQHSFDTKSMASVTTFAMDEKESIRPDDSASVRAADDEEGASALSRNVIFHAGPDVIMPALHGSGRVGTQTTAITVRRFHTLTNPPRFGSLEETIANQQDEEETTASADLPDPRDEQPALAPPSVLPDEKLLDALASPKERLSLLQLEEKLLAFISQSTIDYIDLPPQHSYARLLAHKLADYYNLPHYINEDGTSIRMFRASASNLPTTLATLAKSIPVGSSQSLGLTAVKIMRRAGLPRQFPTADSTAPSSSAPSKATSDAGHSEEGLVSPTEASTPSRDKTKLTREEREAQYKAVRERIFGNMEELAIGESFSTGENSASLSRSSSSSGKKKTRKQRAPKDDSFDSRSAFIPSYGPMHVQQMPSYQSQQYVEQSYPEQYEVSAEDYGPQVNYSSTPTQAYPGFEQNTQFSNPVSYGPNPAQSFGSAEGWSPMQSPNPGGLFNYPQTYTQASSGHPQNMGSMVHQMNPQYAQPQPTTMQQSQNWNSQYQSPYQPAMNQHSGPEWQGYQPYPQQFGQIQSHQMQQTQYPPSSQPSVTPQYQPPGPINMNNNIHRAGTLFNPQTKTFVPSSGPGRAGNRQNRKKISPSSTNNQSRQNSVGKSHSSNNTSTISLQSLRNQDSSGNGTVFSRFGHDSLQQKYGKPANLPKKPPPSQTLSQFDAGSIQGVRNINGNSSVHKGNAEARDQ